MTKRSYVAKSARLGYLPNECPSFGKLLLYALQQFLVMFPATVTVALLTGFDVPTTIFASGFSTLCVLLITRGQIPLYYGSSFSYITAIVAITSATVGEVASTELVGEAQFGIVISGLVSIVAGILVKLFGRKVIDKVLPPSITGSISLLIGLSLAVSALTPAIGYDATSGVTNGAEFATGLVTLFSCVLFSVYLKKGVLGQLPILFGITIGYVLAICLGLVDFSFFTDSQIVIVPRFSLPIPNWMAVAAIMPIALATIPESTAHLYQLDIYVNDLAKREGKPRIDMAGKLGLSLVGDGMGDIISGMMGGPAGTNYGENVSTMAITKNFSSYVLGVTAIFAMAISFFKPITGLVQSVPTAVIDGACIYLFGVIAAQGIAIMVNQKVDFFNPRNLAVIATVLIIGIGGTFGFDNGMIPVFGYQFPAIATASIFGILLNLLLGIAFKKKGKDEGKGLDKEKTAEQPATMAVVGDDEVVPSQTPKAQ